MENGYQYFLIVEAQQYSEDSTYTTPTTTTTKVNPVTNTKSIFTVMLVKPTHKKI